MPSSIAPIVWKDRKRRRRLRAKDRECQSAPPCRGMAAETYLSSNTSQTTGVQIAAEAKSTPVGQSIRRKVRCWTNSMFQSDSSSDSDICPSPGKGTVEVQSSTVMKSLGRLPLANSPSDPPVESRVLEYGSELGEEDDMPLSPYPASPPQNRTVSATGESQARNKNLVDLHDAAADTENVSPNGIGSGKKAIQQRSPSLSPLQPRSPNIAHVRATAADLSPALSPVLSPAASPLMLAPLQETPPTLSSRNRDTQLFMKLARNHCFDSTTDASDPEGKDQAAACTVELSECEVAEIIEPDVESDVAHSDTDIVARNRILLSTPGFLQGAHPPLGPSSPYVLPISPSFSFGSIGKGSDIGQESAELEAFGSQSTSPTSPALRASTRFLPVSQRSLQTAAVSEGSSQSLFSMASQQSSMSLVNSAPEHSPAASEVSIRSSFLPRRALVEVGSLMSVENASPSLGSESFNGTDCHHASSGHVVDSAIFNTVDLSSTVEDCSVTAGPLKDLLEAAKCLNAHQPECVEEAPVSPEDLETLRHFLDALPEDKMPVSESLVSSPFANADMYDADEVAAEPATPGDTTPAPVIFFKPSRIPRFSGITTFRQQEPIDEFQAFEADVEKVPESFDMSCSTTPVKGTPLKDVPSGPGTPVTPGMTFISPEGLDGSFDNEEDEDEELFRLTQLLDGLWPACPEELSSPSVFDVAVDLSGVSLASSPSPFILSQPDVPVAVSDDEGQASPLPAEPDFGSLEVAEHEPSHMGVFSPQSLIETSSEELPRAVLDFEDAEVVPVQSEASPGRSFSESVAIFFFISLCFAATCCTLVLFNPAHLQRPKSLAWNTVPVQPAQVKVSEDLFDLAAQLDDLVSTGQVLSLGVLSHKEHVCSPSLPFAPHLWQSYHPEDKLETLTPTSCVPKSSFWPETMASAPLAVVSQAVNDAESPILQLQDSQGSPSNALELMMAELEDLIVDGATLCSGNVPAAQHYLKQPADKSLDMISNAPPQATTWQSLMDELDALVVEGEHLVLPQAVAGKSALSWVDSLPGMEVVRRTAVDLGLKASVAAVLARAGRWMVPSVC